MQFNEHQVVIAGGGPTGLMLAGELALAGVDVAIVEQRLTQEVEGSRAGGLHPRAIELLDQRGIAEPFLAQGKRHPVVMFAGVVLDASDRPTRHSYTLALWQDRIEQGLADWVAGLSVRIYRGATVAGFQQADTHVDVELSDGRQLRAPYLVGCDGGRSLVRKTAGIDFPGWEPSLSYLIFEASLPDAPALGLRHGERGVHALGRLEENGDRIRGVVTEERLENGTATESQLRSALIAAYGSDFGLSDITWLSRFTDAARQAATYRKGRVLVAGDAAHVHSPVGGQGLNVGLQDAVNLGWKLAQVVKGEAPDSLLDSYHAERHPAGAALLQHTLALTALNRGDARSTALRELTARTMQLDEPRKWYCAMMSGLDIRYDCGDGHPLLGWRMPDLDIVTADGPTRIFALLHAARPVMLTFGKPPAIDGWQDRVRLIEASCDGVCELPVVGIVPLPAAVLIRPDGHVAWVGDDRAEGLTEALTAWFGPASA